MFHIWYMGLANPTTGRHDSLLFFIIIHWAPVVCYQRVTGASICAAICNVYAGLLCDCISHFFSHIMWTGFFGHRLAKTIIASPDIAWWVQVGGLEMAFHHTIALISILTSWTSGEAHLNTIWMLSTEFTTPLINNRWWLEKMVRLYYLNSAVLIDKCILDFQGIVFWVMLHVTSECVSTLYFREDTRF